MSLLNYLIQGTARGTFKADNASLIMTAERLHLTHI